MTQRAVIISRGATEAVSQHGGVSKSHSDSADPRRRLCPRVQPGEGESGIGRKSGLMFAVH
eukprot:12380742-Alexandrium_andersonii.AAC.1